MNDLHTHTLHGTPQMGDNINIGQSALFSHMTVPQIISIPGDHLSRPG